jgi:hypothetical protein
VTRYLTEDVFDPTGATPNHDQLQAVIDGMSGDGGGCLVEPVGWTLRIDRPVILKPGVTFRSEGHRGGWQRGGPNYDPGPPLKEWEGSLKAGRGVMPLVATFGAGMFGTGPGGSWVGGPNGDAGPYTTPQGFIAGPQSRSGAVVNLSRSVVQRWYPADGSIELTVTVTRTGATEGWVWTHGGAVLSTETPVICGLRLDAGRFQVVTHHFTGQTVASDVVVGVNDAATVRVKVDADGTPHLWVNGTEATARNGTPTPLPAHKHYHQTLVGGVSGRWNQWQTQGVADCRVKDLVWKNLYADYHLAMTDQDGPYMLSGDGTELHVAEHRIPLQGRNGCGLENVTLHAQYGVGAWLDNTQDATFRDLTITAMVGFLSANNVYAASVRDLRLNASHVAVQCVNNAAMLALRDVHPAGAPLAGVSLANCYGANLDDWWVGAVQAGGCAVHVDGPGCTAVLRSFRFFDEGASGGTPAHLTNTRSVHFDHGCVLQRSTPGPAAVVDGGGAYHFDGILSAPDRLNRIQVVAPPEAVTGTAAVREWF